MSTFTGQISGISVPQNHAELEGQLRELQASAGPSIPERRFKSLVSTVVLPALGGVTEAAKKRAQFKVVSLALAARMLTMISDDRSGAIGTERGTEAAIHKLEETRIGKEALLRVVQAVSKVIVEAPVAFPSPSPSLPEIYQATILFAAQPLLAELRKEAVYLQAEASHSHQVK